MLRLYSPLKPQSCKTSSTVELHHRWSNKNTFSIICYTYHSKDFNCEITVVQ